MVFSYMNVFSVKRCKPNINLIFYFIRQAGLSIDFFYPSKTDIYKFPVLQ